MQNTSSCACYVLKRQLNEHPQVFSVFKEDNNSTQSSMKAADHQKNGLRDQEHLEFTKKQKLSERHRSSIPLGGMEKERQGTNGCGKKRKDENNSDRDLGDGIER